MRGKLFFALIAGLLLATSGFAATTGTLKGRVTDTAGTDLPGATVTISSPKQLGGDKVQQTDAEGHFFFPAIDPGPYVVRVELDGYTTQERTEVQVRLDRTTEIVFELPTGQFEEQVVVTGERSVIDPDQVSVSQTFTEEYLQKASVGTSSRSYQNVLIQAPGTAGGDNPKVGANLGSNAWLVDGFSITDPVTSTWSGNYSFDVVQEVSFQTFGYEAEYGQATGGVVNVITKSGGNEFSGALDVRYYDQSFYQDGEFFDTSTLKQKTFIPSFSIGGPIVHDRLWFFTSYSPVESQSTTPGSPTTFDFQGDYRFAKLSWQVSPRWRTMFKYNDDPTDIANAGSSAQFRPPEAQRRQEQGGNVIQGELSAVLSENALWTSTLGVSRRYLDSTPMSGNLDVPGAQNITTNLYSANYSVSQLSDRDRDYLASSLTYFADDLAGSHEFKFGLSYDDISFSDESFYHGDAFFTRRNVVDPLDGSVHDIYRTFYYNPNHNTATYTGSIQGFYAQDAWHLRPNLTLKLGVRYDEASFDNNLGDKVADLDKIQPRLGLAWDITGDGKTIGRVNLGRFMHPSALTTASFARRGLDSLPTLTAYSCNYFRQQVFGLPSNYPVSCDVLAGLLGYSQIIQDPFGYENEGWIVVQTTGGAGQTSIVDPNLDPTYQDGLVLSVERQLWKRTSVELTYVDKKTEDLFEDTCNGNIPTPSADADCDYFVMSNLPVLKGDYHNVILRIESRATDWLHINSSITWASSKGNLEYTQNSGTEFDFYPDHYVNAYGYLSDHRDLRFRLNGYVELPLDFLVGVDAFYSTGAVFNHTTAAENAGYGETFLEPRGSYEGNDNYQLDLQVSKAFHINRVDLQLIGTVFNVFDTERPVDRCENDGGCGSTALYEPIDWQRPRRFQVGVRLEF